MPGLFAGCHDGRRDVVSSAWMTLMAVSMSVVLAGYLALFAVVGLLFVAANLTIGIFLRPHDPHPEKQEIYECGEPTIGSGFVQFDLRFYTVALLFIIFDVEVAFFFPWAAVFGKSANLSEYAAAPDRVTKASRVVDRSPSGELALKIGRAHV